MQKHVHEWRKNLQRQTSIRDNRGRFVPGSHWRAHAIFRERDYLLREYIERGRSSAEIAVEHGVHENAIRHWLVKHEIPRRTTSEVRRKKYWGQSGAANPMFGKVGPLNPRWVDGSSPERQRAYVSAAGKEFTKAVFARDGYRCRRCGGEKKGPRGLHVHHIKPWAGNKTLRFALSNVVTLCRACHEWVHSKANSFAEFVA